MLSLLLGGDFLICVYHQMNETISVSPHNQMTKKIQYQKQNRPLLRNSKSVHFRPWHALRVLPQIRSGGGKKLDFQTVNLIRHGWLLELLVAVL